MSSEFWAKVQSRCTGKNAIVRSLFIIFYYNMYTKFCQEYPMSLSKYLFIKINRI